MARKTYTGPLVNVTFDGALCEHAAECVRGMPEVFNTSARPWINPGWQRPKRKPIRCAKSSDAARRARC